MGKLYLYLFLRLLIYKFALFTRATLLARYYGPVSVTLSVSVISRNSIETAKQIKLVFSLEASFHLSYTMFKEIRVSPTIRVPLSGTLSKKLWT